MAQRLLDQLGDPRSEINTAYGAPDPTDGGHDPVRLPALLYFIFLLFPDSCYEL